MLYNFSADQLMIFLPDECKRTVLPRGIKIVHLTSKPRTPNRLLELGLRRLYDSRSFYDHVCAILPEGILPHEIHQAVINGPPCLCGYSGCETPIFMECNFTLLKK